MSEGGDEPSPEPENMSGEGGNELSPEPETEESEEPDPRAPSQLEPTSRLGEGLLELTLSTAPSGWVVPAAFPQLTNYKYVPPAKGGRRASIVSVASRTMSKKLDERVVLIGLQGVGKTVLCNQLGYPSPMNLSNAVSMPTQTDGEVMYYEPSPAVRMMIWDMSGAPAARDANWADQCALASCVMFVFDCSDPETLPLAKKELLRVIGEAPSSAPLLVWGNKMDVEGSIGAAELSDELQLNAVCPTRQWCVQGSVFHDRARGVEHGMAWLSAACAHRPKKKFNGWHDPPLVIENTLPADDIVTPVPRSTSQVSQAPPPTPDVGRGSLRGSFMGVTEEQEEEDDDDTYDASSPMPSKPPPSPAQASSGASDSPRDGGDGHFQARHLTNFSWPEDKGKPIKMPAKREFRVLVVGLASCGKSTLVMQIDKKCQISWTTPLTSLGGEMTLVSHAKNSLILWDMNGSDEGRAHWAQRIEDQQFSAVLWVTVDTLPAHAAHGPCLLLRGGGAGYR